MLIFEEFLNENNVKSEDFIKYCNEYVSNTNNYPLRKYQWNTCSLYEISMLSYLKRAFNWHNTKEGYEFWNELDKKWCLTSSIDVYFGFGIDKTIERKDKKDSRVAKNNLVFKL